MSKHGWLGLAILIGGEVTLLAGLDLAATFFTPIMWTGYIVLADAVIAGRVGDSYLTGRRREFLLMVVLSVLSWLMFEAYNLRLQNWRYQGLPDNLLVRNFGFFWSFATITPALITTAELLGALGWPRPAKRSVRQPASLGLSVSFVVGLAFALIPPLLPSGVAPLSFGFVWLGFILLLEPLNYRAGAPSLYRDWLEGRPQRVWQFLAGGLICGLLWELWNLQTLPRGGGGWIYTIPDQLRVFGWHYGKMPVLGLLGFPPFAMECFAIYHFLRRALFPAWVE